MQHGPPEAVMAIWVSSLTPILLAAQTAGASVAGTVRDAATGAPLAGATVTLADLDRSTVTDALGRYALAGVPAGPQHVVVRRVQYEPRAFHALVPPRGIVTIDVALTPLPVTLAPLEVRARATVPARGLDADDGATFPDRSLSAAAVRHHPALSEPDVLLAAGGGAVMLDPESPAGVHVRGAPSDQLVYLVDGIPVFSPYHTGGTFAAWNPDAVARVDLVTSSPAPQFPDALAGAMAATTRRPGTTVRADATMSTTQARATLDGPLGARGAGFLASVRSAFPGLVLHGPEASYLAGEGGDWLGKVEAPAFGGRLSLLGVGAEDEIGAAGVDSLRHAFWWMSRSFGAAWSGPLGDATLVVRAWRALGDAGGAWRGDSATARLRAHRQDDGLVFALQWSGGASHTAAGVRAHRGTTFYDAGAAGDSLGHLRSDTRTPVSAAFVQHQRALAATLDVDVALTGVHAARAMHLAPAAGLRWRVAEGLAVTTRYARRHQFAQSLRNPESVAAAILPVDLYAAAEPGGVPVATSDLGLVALDLRPTAGVRVRVQAFAQRFEGLALVAPRDAGPFATTGVTVGRGAARGIALEAAASGARYAVVATYGLQDVRLTFGDSTYVPGHGARHTLDAGVIAFPSPSAAIRLGASAAFGRRGTAVTGPFEWEACNLLDQGCEFAGSPGRRVEPLGATALPAYVRLDLGLRKHWHVRVAGRDGQVAVFGTVTNILGRRNVLTAVVDPATATRRTVAMRPFAPLVVGLDWRF
jgi:hypothetical protein